MQCPTCIKLAIHDGSFFCAQASNNLLINSTTWPFSYRIVLRKVGQRIKPFIRKLNKACIFDSIFLYSSKNENQVSYKDYVDAQVAGPLTFRGFDFTGQHRPWRQVSIYWAVELSWLCHCSHQSEKSQRVSRGRTMLTTQWVFWNQIPDMNSQLHDDRDPLKREHGQSKPNSGVISGRNWKNARCLQGNVTYFLCEFLKIGAIFSLAEKC